MSARPDKFTDRLSFALRPDAATLASIEAARDRLRAEQGLLSQPLAPEQLQITLHHLGDFVRFPQAIADQAIAAAATLSAPAFEIVLDQALSLERRQARTRPCVLAAGGESLAAMKAFHAGLVAALKAAGLYRYASFAPHLTLMHDVTGFEPHPIEPIRWTPGEFVLLNSQLAKGEQVVLGAWPLRAT